MSKKKTKSTKTKKGSKKKAATKASASKRPRKATDAKTKPLSALDAAAKVLANAGKPMRAQELITTMAEQDLWQSPGGKTPHATLYAAMLREESNKGSASRFKKVDRGQFEYHAPKSP